MINIIIIIIVKYYKYLVIIEIFIFERMEGLVEMIAERDFIVFVFMVIVFFVSIFRICE